MREVIVKDKTFVGDPKRFNGSRDDNALGFSWRPGQKEERIHIDKCVIDANGVAEGLKLSYCNDVTVTDCTIIGGYEDCVDIVRGSNIKFINCRFIAKNTKTHFTIKGGATNIQIIDCEFDGEYKSLFDGACVDLGNWSNYDVDDRPKTRGIVIKNCKLTNFRWFKKVLTRRLYAKSPTVLNTPGFVLNVPSFFVKLFWKLRRHQVKK